MRLPTYTKKKVGDALILSPTGTNEIASQIKETDSSTITEQKKSTGTPEHLRREDDNS